MIRIFLAVLMTATVAAGQEATTSQKSIVPVNTFSTDEGNPETIARILGDQFPDIAFSADAESSTIFARVDGEDAERVERLISEISHRAARALSERRAWQAAEQAELESKTDVLKTYQLNHVPAVEAARILHTLGFDAKANIAAVGSSLVMRGPASTFEQVAALLKEVDVPQEVNDFIENVTVDDVGVLQRIDPRWEVEVFKHSFEQEHQRDDSDLEEKSQALSTMIRGNRDAGAIKRMRDELSKLVQQQFRMKMDRERRELDQIRRRLEKITQRLEMQERLTSQIVQQRVEQLIADDEGMLMRQERELADQQQQQLRARASESMRRDQKSALRQLETALQSLRAEELQRGERLKGEQAQLRERLEADYRVLKNAAELELSEDPFSDVEIEIRDDLERDNQIRDDLELLEREPSRDDVMRDRTEAKQLREVQVLEQMKAELEVLQALQNRGGKKLDGRTAEHKAMLEQAYKDLKRQLRPDDVIEESTDQDSDSESDDMPVDDDDEKDDEVEQPVSDLEIEVF